MKFIAAFLIVAVLVIAACAPQQPLQPQENKSDDKTAAEAECGSDSDCGIGGCSGQVCATAEKASGLITTCEYREEYSCLKLTSCGCVQGRCAWKENAEYKACVEKIKAKGI
ncbi:MAG: eight-cysteine-cluster domain-containing protein [Nanoarchaeota archaeon]